MQVPLSLPGLYETSARRAGIPVLPATRGECAGGAAARMARTEECPHLLCRYHILRDLAHRKGDDEAVAALVAREEGRWSSACALDYADDGPQTHSLIAATLGVSRERAVQMSAEAASRLRPMMPPDTV